MQLPLQCISPLSLIGELYRAFLNLKYLKWPLKFVLGMECGCYCLFLPVSLASPTPIKSALTGACVIEMGEKCYTGTEQYNMIQYSSEVCHVLKGKFRKPSQRKKLVRRGSATVTEC